MPTTTNLRDGPDVARIAALIGDPARAAMLTALMSGKALTATELAHEGGIGAATASAHIAKLEAGGLVVSAKQGRHRYLRLADTDVADVLERLMGVAVRTGHLRTRTGPRDPALRRARVCYDHLAGDLGVALYDRLIESRWIADTDGELTVTAKGRRAVADLGVDIDTLGRPNAPVCRRCLDWSERKSHLGGPLGVALLDIIFAKKWARRDKNSRAVSFSAAGEANFRATFNMRK